MNFSKVAQNIRLIPKLFSDSNSLTKKASLNALASALDYGGNIIVGFIITPFIVSSLGDYYYGAWHILLRLIGYISPASGRPTQTLKFILAQKQSSTDYDLKRSYVGSTLAVFSLFLPLMSVLGGMLSWFVPYWIKTPPEYIWNIRIACAILVINLITSSLVAIPRSVLEGENKGYKRMGLSTFLIFVGGGLTWLALQLKLGIIGVAGSTLLSSIISGFFFLQVAHTYSPWFGIAKPEKAAVREFFGMSWWFLAWNLIMNLMMASDVVVLGLLNSVESVTNYTLSKYAPETSISVISIVVFGILPGLGGIIGSGDMERAARVRGEIMSLSWLIVTVMGAAIILWNRTFIGLWVGADHFVGTLPNLLIVAVILQFILIRNDANVIDLTLHLSRKVTMGAISVIISLASACALVYYFDLGIFGVCTGIILGRLILTIGYPIQVGRMLKIKFSSQIKAILRPSIVTILLFFSVALLEGILPTNSWHSLGGWILFLVSVSASFCVILLLTFVLGLNGHQQRNIYRRFRAVFTLSTQNKD